MSFRLSKFILLAIVSASLVQAQTVKSSWNATKNAAADNVYHDNDKTLYCGCTYGSDNDNDGSGDVDMQACGITPLSKYSNRTDVLEWEHIVPASLLPAGKMSCWTKSHRFQKCVAKGEKTRDCCERVSQSARNMIFDLHNLAPSIGQVNAYRLNDRYGEVPDSENTEIWPGCEVRHLRVKPTKNHRFEPADCTKGDVARVWFYMHRQHGVSIPDDEWNMFVEWDAADPVSAWELERDERIAAVQGNHNPFVAGFEASPEGACPWDPQ